MEHGPKKSWALFILIIIALWILFIALWILFNAIGFYSIFSTTDLDKLSARVLYYGLFMLFLTYYGARKYNETGSHRSYLFLDLLLIALTFVIFIGLEYYISIFGLY